MRWKLLFVFVALLGALHFLASPMITRAFQQCASRYYPDLSVQKISLDLINSQASFKNLRLELQRQKKPLVEIRDVILHWAFLPLLSKQLVLEEVSVVGATLVLPVGPDLQDLLGEIKNGDMFRKNGDMFRIRKNSVRVPIFFGRDFDLAAFLEPYRRRPTQDTIVHYPPQHLPILVRNVYLSDIGLHAAQVPTNRPPLPSLVNLNATVRNMEACFGPSEQPMEFSLQSRLGGQEASYVKIEGTLQRGQDGLGGSCDIRLENLDIAQLWPWINPAWLPEDFSQFQVTEGKMDLSSHVQISQGHWSFQNNLTLKKLRLQVDASSPYKKIKGASPDLVMQAINTLGETQFEFSDYGQWRAAFEENVMKGVRNLIRKSIQDTLQKMITLG